MMSNASRATLLFCLLLVLLVPLGATSADGPDDNAPWLGYYPPKRTFWVTPDGTGNGRSPEEPMSFAAAIVRARPGDFFWLQAGVYQGGRDLILTGGGTAAAPIVYRACPGAQVTLDGGVGYLSPYTWLWGLEITNLTPLVEDVTWTLTPDGPIKGGSALVNVRVPGGRLINNVIHDSQSSQSGIGAWDGGANQVYYGNIVYSNGHDPELEQPPHGVYSQNNLAESGFKYFVGNLFLDHGLVCGEKCYNFHAHSQGEGYVSGYYLRDNVFAGGRVAIGGANAHFAPSDQHVISHNYFYDTGKIQLGFRRPWQGQFTHNYVAGNSSVLLNVWGSDETQFSPAAFTIVKNNTFVHNEALHYLDLFAMTSTSPIGAAALRPDDVINENVYGEGVKVKYWVNGRTLSLKTLAEWQAQSEQDRGTTPFDAASSVVPNPTENAVFLIANEYEAGRAHLAIYNWAGSAATEVDLGGLLAEGSAFAIKDAKDFYGPPLLAATYQGEAIAVPTPNPFHSYVVLPAGPGPCTNPELLVP